MRTRLLVLLFALALPFSMHSGALGTGSQTCPASGRKQLSTTQTRAMWVSIQSPTANTGKVYVGGPAITTSVGNYAVAGGSVFLPTAGNSAPYDLSATWIACTVSEDTVTYTYLQ
jgi:hypothetical protein